MATAEKKTRPTELKGSSDSRRHKDDIQGVYQATSHDQANLPIPFELPSPPGAEKKIKQKLNENKNTSLTFTY